ncbi:unnamed protein product, partial [marine sediment metagenome]
MAKKERHGLFRRIFSTVVTAPANLITSGIEQLTGKKYGRTTPTEFRETKVGKALGTAAAVVTVPLAVLSAPVTVSFC